MLHLIFSIIFHYLTIYTEFNRITMRIVFIEITLYHYTIFVFTWLVLRQLQNTIKKKIFHKIFWYAVCKFMSTTIKIKLTGYIYNINGNKIWKIKWHYHISSYYIWPFKARWQQQVTHTHTWKSCAIFCYHQAYGPTLYKTNIWQISLK